MLDVDLRQAVAQVQQGQENLRDELVKKYLPFILKTTSQSCKRFVRLGVDDEVSIALIAFDEALDKYDSAQNTSFFYFAEAVINRRIIDYFRKKNRENREIPWSSINQDEQGEETAYQLDRLTWEKAKSIHFEKEAAQLRHDEIMEYQKELTSYGLTLRELVEVSPKHQDARKSAYEIARLISENEQFSAHLRKTKTLPLKDLERVASISRKTLERQRKYIIALTIILIGRFYFLDEYLEGLKR